MPVKIKKVDGYQVSTPHGVHAKHTSKRKAMAQRNLLNAVEHGWKPTGKKARSKKKKKGYNFAKAERKLGVVWR
jgi:hypothetical protein